MAMKKCVHCKTIFTKRYQVKFCSNKCQFRYQHEKWIEDWKGGKVNGGIGITAKIFLNISGDI
jgi:hypothetical protein